MESNNLIGEWSCRVKDGNGVECDSVSLVFLSSLTGYVRRDEHIETFSYRLRGESIEFFCDAQSRKFLIEWVDDSLLRLSGSTDIELTRQK